MALPPVSNLVIRDWLRHPPLRQARNWCNLSVESREVFLELLVPYYQGNPFSVRPASVAGRPAQAVEELTRWGLVRRTGTTLTVPNQELCFAQCLFDLKNCRLLDASRPAGLEGYVHSCFHRTNLNGMITTVVQATGVRNPGCAKDFLTNYVARHRWPLWIVRMSEDPLVEQLVKALLHADGPVPVVSLPEMLPEVQPQVVDRVLRTLLSCMVLFLDLDPGTRELIMGLLPSVRQEMSRFRPPRTRPVCEPCPSPREVAPEGSALVADLRAFLLEVSARPPRLRQNGDFYQKEEARLLEALPTHPPWLEHPNVANKFRQRQVYLQAAELRMVQRQQGDSGQTLMVSATGKEWLASDVAEQYLALFRHHQPLPQAGLVNAYGWGTNDLRFLGCSVRVVPGARVLPDGQVRVTPDDAQVVRDAILEVLTELPVGVFYPVRDFIARAVFREHNPLLAGRNPDELLISTSDRPVPNLEEHLEEIGAACLQALICSRLIPLGCLQAAVDAEGKLLMARLPRLEAYWGRPVSRQDLAGMPETTGQVVVQPDFTVIVIGPNPAPAIELAAFTDRVQGHAGQGAIVLKLSRSSVIRAVQSGLTEADILARLERHASRELPANVRVEIHEWSEAVCRATWEPVLVVRCPTDAVADRVQQVLGKQAERVNPTMVVVPGQKLDPAKRKKLETTGIMVAPSDSEGSASDAKRKRGKHR